MKRLLAVLGLFLAPMTGWAACVPTQATPGMPGCQPVASSIASTDYVQVWIPGAFPASAKIIQVQNLLPSLAGYLPLTGGTVTGLTTFSGAGTGLAVTNNETVGGLLTVGNVTTPGSTVTFSGASSPTRISTLAANLVGSSTLTGNLSWSLNQMGSASDTLAIPNGTISGLTIASNFGAGFDGSRVGFTAQLNQVAATNFSSPTSAGLVGASLIVANAYNSGGSATGFGTTSFGKGQYFGAVVGYQLQSGATYMLSGIGFEIDNELRAGASSAVLSGLQLVHSGSHAVQGTNVDVGLSLGDQVTTSTGWKTVISQGRYDSQWNTGNYGYLYQVQTGVNRGSFPAVAAGGFDLNQLTVTAAVAGNANADGSIKAPEGGNFFWRSPGLQILDTGVQVGYGALTNGAASVILDASYYKMATAAGAITVNVGGANFTTGDMACDIYGDCVIVTAAAGVVTGVSSVVTQGYQTSAPADPVTFNARVRTGASLGTGLKLNLGAWTAPTTISIGPTVATTINIGRSGQTTKINGSVGFSQATPGARVDILGADTSSTLSFRVQSSTPSTLFSVANNGTVTAQNGITLGVASTTAGTAIFEGGTSGAITIVPTAIAGSNTITLPAATGTVALDITGTTSSIGGGALGAGACASGTATVTGATTGMAVAVSPASNPQVDASHGLAIWGYISSANTATVEVCAIVATTPNAVAYNVRVLQ